MAEIRIGIRDLKPRLSQYLKYVKAGRIITITDRGKAIGRIVPNQQPLEDKLQTLLLSGRAAWNGERLKPAKPEAKTKKGHSIADLLIEDRT
jgi:prevent-host-death family protein